MLKLLWQRRGGRRGLQPHPVDLPLGQAVALRHLRDGSFGGLAGASAAGELAAGRVGGSWFDGLTMSGGGGTLDDQGELAAGHREPLQRLADGPPEHLLEPLGELAADGEAAVAELRVQVGEAATEPVGRLEGDDGAGVV